jgi:hypothetical protein
MQSDPRFEGLSTPEKTWRNNTFTSSPFSLIGDGHSNGNDKLMTVGIDSRPEETSRFSHGEGIGWLIATRVF